MVRGSIRHCRAGQLKSLLSNKHALQAVFKAPRQKCCALTSHSFASVCKSLHLCDLFQHSSVSLSTSSNYNWCQKHHLPNTATKFGTANGRGKELQDVCVAWVGKGCRTCIDETNVHLQGMTPHKLQTHPKIQRRLRQVRQEGRGIRNAKSRLHLRHEQCKPKTRLGSGALDWQPYRQVGFSRR